MGASWGLTIPLTKLAVSEDYQEFGLIFWQQMICFGILVFWYFGSGGLAATSKASVRTGTFKSLYHYRDLRHRSAKYRIIYRRRSFARRGIVDFDLDGADVCFSNSFVVWD